MAKEFMYLIFLGYVAGRMSLDKYDNKLMRERVTSHFGVKWAYTIHINLLGASQRSQCA
jgi:hypothetical protein